MSKHFRFIARTVFVDNRPGIDNAIESGIQRLENQLNREQILQTMKRNRYYEKPWMRRRRIAYTECTKIYNDEMKRKLNFLLKSNRDDPWRVG